MNYKINRKIQKRKSTKTNLAIDQNEREHQRGHEAQFRGDRSPVRQHRQRRHETVLQRRVREWIHVRDRLRDAWMDFALYCMDGGMGDVILIVSVRK